MTSPARAGNRNVAAKPITVVRNAVPKRVGPIGGEQILPPKRADGVGHARQRRPRAAAATGWRAGFQPRRRPRSRCEGRRPATRGSAGRSGRSELVAACAGLWSVGIRIQGLSGLLDPGEGTTGIAPSLWENVSYC